MTPKELQYLCDQYDTKVRRIAILEREIEELKQETRDIYERIRHEK